MRKLILAAVAVAIAGAPLATVAKAEGTTTTQNPKMGTHKTVKKYQNRATPHENQKMMMHHNQQNY